MKKPIGYILVAAPFAGVAVGCGLTYGWIPTAGGFILTGLIVLCFWFGFTLLE